METQELSGCSFCSKNQSQVVKIIAGPGVFICDECIDLCNEIIVEESRPARCSMCKHTLQGAWAFCPGCGVPSAAALDEEADAGAERGGTRILTALIRGTGASKLSEIATAHPEVEGAARRLQAHLNELFEQVADLGERIGVIYYLFGACGRSMSSEEVSRLLGLAPERVEELEAQVGSVLRKMKQDEEGVRA